MKCILRDIKLIDPPQLFQNRWRRLQKLTPDRHGTRILRKKKILLKFQRQILWKRKFRWFLKTDFKPKKNGGQNKNLFKKGSFQKSIRKLFKRGNRNPPQSRCTEQLWRKSLDLCQNRNSKQKCSNQKRTFWKLWEILKNSQKQVFKKKTYQKIPKRNNMKMLMICVKYSTPLQNTQKNMSFRESL